MLGSLRERDPLSPTRFRQRGPPGPHRAREVAHAARPGSAPAMGQRQRPGSWCSGYNDVFRERHLDQGGPITIEFVHPPERPEVIDGKPSPPGSVGAGTEGGLRHGPARFEGRSQPLQGRLRSGNRLGTCSWSLLWNVSGRPWR
jgi:hypothetical protein